MIHPSALIHPGVHLDDGAVVGAFVILGEPPGGRMPGALETWIGAGALIRSHTVIYAGNRLGQRLQTGHGVLIREENRIGDDVSIGSHSNIEHHVTIGNGVRLHSNAFVPEYTVLEDGCWLGPGVVLTNARYPGAPDEKRRLRGPVIRTGATLGANVTVLPGVIIGAHALVGAGATVVRDVPEGKVVAGNPARIINAVEEIEAYRVRHARAVR